MPTIWKSERKFRYKTLKALLKSLRNGSSYMSACKAADISIVTFYNWRKQNEKFNRIITEIYDSRIAVVEDVLYKKAMEGDNNCIFFFLKNRAKDRWKDRPEGEEQSKAQIQIINYGIQTNQQQIQQQPIDVEATPTSNNGFHAPQVAVRSFAGEKPIQDDSVAS